MTGLLLIGLVAAAPWEGRAAAGAEVGPAAFGMLDLGLRRGDVSVEWLTDTLDLRWQPSGERGRGWLGARAEGGAAGMYLARWSDGAPMPERSHLASYVGVDGGALRYGPRGLYGGAQASARVWLFHPLAATAIEVPGPTPVVSADAIGGWWRPALHAWVRAGADWTPDGLAPHVAWDARGRWPGVFTPRAEVRGAVAAHQGDVLRTRVGGLNPYVVPVAGAAWAEWWAEDFVAVRAGPGLTAGRVDAAVVADAAWIDGLVVAGLAATCRYETGPWTVELAAGGSPWIDRPRGVPAASVLLRVSRDWRPQHAVDPPPEVGDLGLGEQGE